MHRWLKISHHSHSGRLRPHEHTSYLPLALLLTVVGVAMMACSVAALSHPEPVGGSIGLTGSMPGPAPKTAAVITTPGEQQRYSTSPVTIAGTCPDNTLVEVYKNNIFAGSGSCSSGGTFSFQADLLFGKNTLIARVYDSLNQPGPDSLPVNVFYDVLPAQASSLTSLNLSGSQLILNTSAVYRGIFPGRPLSIPIDIIGGTPPYAINVQWGDSKNNVVPRDNNIPFNVEHTYNKPGNYQITIQGSDSQGRIAVLTVVAIVNGQPVIAPVASTTNPPIGKLMVLWPLFASAVTIVISFWLGERREKQVLLRASKLTLHPQV